VSEQTEKERYEAWSVRIQTREREGDVIVLEGELEVPLLGYRKKEFENIIAKYKI
jgi:hypothetical protein